MVEEVAAVDLEVEGQEGLKGHEAECELKRWATTIAFDKCLDYLRDPDCRVEQE